ncbi:MAG: hypothetical protein ACRCVG_02795 [Methanobacteriaceae archaeon]
MSKEVFFKLKLDEDLRTEIKIEAIKNKTTMNEIIIKCIKKNFNNL